jgi:hypothetical protein
VSPALTPVATVTVDVGSVEYLEAHAGRVLAANATTAAVALTTAGGRQLFARTFPGSTLGSVRLSKTGDRVFISLMATDAGAATALWLDENGKTLWRRSGTVTKGLYDANIAADGRSFQLVVLASGTSPTGLPDFEVIDDAGRTVAASGASRAAVASVQNSSDLARTVVTSLIATDTSGETPPTTVVDRYERTKRLSRDVYPQMQGSVYLSPSGSLMLSTIGASTMSMRSWSNNRSMWKQTADGAAVVAFDSTESRMFAMRLASAQTGDLVAYASSMEVRDCATGAALWSTTWTGMEPLHPVVNEDLSSIAMVPIAGAPASTIYRRSGDSYEPIPLPAGTTTACFTDEGRLVLGSASGITLY